MNNPKTYQIRFNTNSTDDTNRWRLVCDGQETLVANIYIDAQTYTTKDFIDVIPEDKINDREFVESVIDKNRQISITKRNEIREYAKSNFSWKKIITQDYLPKIFSNI